MTTVLVTGYGPFGHTPVNPAETVARALDGARIGGATVVGAVVPNVFFKVVEVVQARIAEVRPEVVIMLGEFGGRGEITVERIAQNLNDGARYRLADNDGVINRRRDRRVPSAAGPASRCSNWRRSASMP